MSLTWPFVTAQVALTSLMPASSAGVDPGKVGKPEGRASQIRPQAVSVWVVVAAFEAAPVAGAVDEEPDGARDAGADGRVWAVVELGAADRPLGPHAATRLAAATSRTSDE